MGFYKIYTEQKQFLDAQRQCRNDGAYLAYPTSDAENTFIAGLVPTANFWIGVNDIDQEDKWVTKDGRDILYANWRNNEPNNVGNDEDAVVIYGSATPYPGLWNDIPKYMEHQFVCSFSFESKFSITNAPCKT